jgi:lysophospholipase L1-like esterase
MFSDDGLHPSETSQRRLAKIITRALAPHVTAHLSPADQEPSR